jgi:hypothetical protein
MSSVDFAILDFCLLIPVVDGEGWESERPAGSPICFPASGQDDFLWIDVFSQNKFRRICLID